MRTLKSDTLLIASCIIMLLSCQSKVTKEKLGKNIASVLGQQSGVFAVAFKDLTTGEEILIDERESFHAASTMKTPVLIEVCKQVVAGKFSLTDSIVLKNEFKSIVDSSVFTLDPQDDSEQELYNHLGEKRSISSLAYDMIIASSNLATNLIIELVDAKNVTQTMRDLGARDIQVLRGVEDAKAFDRGLINTTTAYDLMVIFEKIANGEAVNPEASQIMIGILSDQKFNEIIPAKLPKDVKVAHKTGNIAGVNHDSGIVFLPDGRKYIVVLLSKEAKDEKAAIAAMASVSEMIYSYMMQP
ncbi:serine hydrolase [Ohtaekwangia koreensis]|uniref:beta-lactamase n=1 Tax=Ohtaekwangia koreensis TaxID=688867 RepID=A0A1T5IQT9_9BACT|nr:serine hydrolase [Ohtaekwangia koreensis]SKC41516.1 beta-lactamase class A [Ohtaekwangia koreensis]